MIGIFAMRWNVVIGGQLFSKSFLGYTTYKMAFATREGLVARDRAHDSSFHHSVGSGETPATLARVSLLARLRQPLRHTEPARPRFISGADAEKRMAQAFDGIASDVEQLSERLRELERRVSALEGRPANAAAAPPASASVALPKSRPPETWRGFPAANVPAGVSVFGKAVLGIAGAYLLRAVAESGTIPQLPVLMVAIVYAGMWLVWAVRTHAANRFASVTYAITSALILSPLLWESTVRFQILRPAFTAAVLVAFVVLALALAWRQNLQAIPWVATLAAVATALALIIATRELVPFTAGLLAVALAAEMVVCLGHRLSVRAVPAIAADFAVWLLVYRDDFSRGRSTGISAHRRYGDHGAVPGAACDLRRKHRPAQLWVAPPVDDLRNRAGSCGVCDCDFWDAARKSWLCGGARRLFSAGCGAVLLGRAVAFHSRRTNSKSSGVRDLRGRTSAGGKLAAFSRGFSGAVLVPGCAGGGFLVLAYWQVEPRHACVLLLGSGGDPLRLF